MSCRSRRWVRACRVGLLATAIGSATVARAQTTRPTTGPTTAAAADFEVREWAVFVFDGLADQLNANGIVTSSLPAFVPTKRTAGPEKATALSPVGVIRIIGRPGERVDVTLGKPNNGAFQASWPRAAERSNGLLWRGLAVADAPGGDGLSKAAAGVGFDALRSTAGGYVIDGRGECERFLLYDATLPYTSPLKVAGSTATTVRIAGVGGAPVHGLTLFRQQGTGWATATVADLRPTTAPTRPATTWATTAAASTAPAADVPTTLSPTELDPAALAAAWVGRAMPEASEADRAVVAGLIVRHGFNGRRLTAVYAMDGAEMDRLLPLEVLPQPRRTSRVGVVILRNIDPSAGTDVDDLIARLGDPSWPQREAASRALVAIGPVAIGKLTAAKRDKDPEVAWRAERALALITPSKPNGDD